MLPSPQEWVVGSTIAGKFTVLGLRGRGGMGDVLQVEHAFTKRIGALKVLNRECAAQPALVERFIREASAAGRIGSPHIVEMFDAGISPEGLPYIFMELLIGQSLEDLLASRGALPFAEALDLVLQAAEGLGAAHRAGIIHRDVKPANLFVVNPGAPLVKVLDFGISKFNLPDPSGPLTVVGTTMGTPLYMSYEQLLSSNSVDLRTDVYALGVVLYECLTARHPFNAETLVALSVAIQRGEFSPVSRLRPDIPKAIDSFFASCLSPILDQRPKDMANLCAELRKHVASAAAPLAASAAPAGVLADTQFAPFTPPPGNSAPMATELSRATTGGASSVAVPVAKARSSAVPALLAGGVILLAAGAFALRMQANTNSASPAAMASGSAAVEAPIAAVQQASAAPSPAAAPSEALPSPVSPQASALEKPPVAPLPKAPVGGETDARTRTKCARLLERLSLGETLSDPDARMYATACKKKRTP
jgi:eukaryotic-like serine/threonine-protein kinase